jgi:hypothetical protein
MYLVDCLKKYSIFHAFDGKRLAQESRIDHINLGLRDQLDQGFKKGLVSFIPWLATCVAVNQFSKHVIGSKSTFSPKDIDASFWSYSLLYPLVEQVGLSVLQKVVETSQLLAFSCLSRKRALKRIVEVASSPSARVLVINALFSLYLAHGAPYMSNSPNKASMVATSLLRPVFPILQHTNNSFLVSLGCNISQNMMMMVLRSFV